MSKNKHADTDPQYTSVTDAKRRQFLKALAAPALFSMLPQSAHANTPQNLIQKAIPSTGELLPVIGMGTWITFNVGSNVASRNARTDVLKTFFELGGRMVDSSPMYGSAEEVMGYAIKRLESQGFKARESLFSTTKVWTRSDGAGQIADSFDLWGLDKFDLFQIHNLLNWQDHLARLKQLKADGRIRYLGITTSHGRRHSDLEAIMETEPLDFVQLTYNVRVRDVEQRLLPLAKEKGIAVIVNRPFGGGGLFDQFARSPLPAWAREIGCDNWAQFMLKFVVSHPAVTCAIPATTQIAHMHENMGAGRGELPDAAMRAKMLAYVQSL
ncbi:aldo/keto reductase [Leucothrix sargassi]|nr:aldo/keto reductase [Leucothrix sargassi]